MVIVCGTDFSEVATGACRTAAQLARRLGDALRIVHVVEPIRPIPPEFGAELGRMELTLREAAQQSVDRLVEELRPTGVTVEGELQTGFADDALTSVARRVGARLIVVGRHGQRAPARWFVGSVAERTVDRADCAVLVVPEEGADLGPWLDGSRPLHVEVGLERSRAVEALLPWLRELRALGPCELHLVHVYWPPEEHARLGLPLPGDPFVRDPGVSAILERELRARLGEVPGAGSVTFEIEASWGKVGSALALQGSTDQAQLVVVATHQRRGFDRLLHGSVTHALMHATRAPILCVPAGPLAPGPLPVPRLERVLCAVDFSAASAATVAYACALVRRGGTLELCHVEPPLEAPAPPAERTEPEEQLRALVPPDASELEVHAQVLNGREVATTILQAAERMGVDAICVGARGHGIRSAWIGTVASQLVARSDRPVLVVHAPR